MSARIYWHTRFREHGARKELGCLADLALPVWTIVWSGTKRDEPYTLTCRLPGIREDVTVSDVDAGKARAEGQLRTFLRLARLAPIDDDDEIARRNAERLAQTYAAPS